MRKQVAAANWKMNLTIDKAETLLTDILKAEISPAENGAVLPATTNGFKTASIGVFSYSAKRLI